MTYTPDQRRAFRDAQRLAPVYHASGKGHRRAVIDQTAAALLTLRQSTLTREDFDYLEQEESDRRARSWKPPVKRDGDPERLLCDVLGAMDNGLDVPVEIHVAAVRHAMQRKADLIDLLCEDGGRKDERVPDDRDAYVHRSAGTRELWEMLLW